MREEINQRDTQDRRQGVWERYYENSSLWWRARFLHGNPHRVCEWYSRNGTLYQKDYFLNIK
jgi:antitoxin component YwqK of YwqJK toxin-antitoxin module